ncbi:MAG: outer membrane protein [Rhizobiaceae bacterium]
MGVFKKIAIAAGAMIVSVNSALAADFIEPVPEVAVVLGGWYLRGDIGMSNQQLHGGLHNSLMNTVDTVKFLDSGTFSSAPMARIGIGYEFNNWFRMDGTVEYRGKADFSALDRYEFTDDGDPLTWDGSNEYDARKSEWLLMANAYMDLGTWYGITPYIGGGVGAAQVTISSFRDINTPNAGVAYASDNSEWNFAWALHAGLGFDITERLTLDLGYSYTNLGDGKTGDVIAFNGTNNINNPTTFEDLHSHDFRFGLIYKLY